MRQNSLYSPMLFKDSPEAPLRGILGTLRDGSNGRFIEQLEKFANTNGFAMQLRQMTPDAENAQIFMWREDIKIIGGTYSLAGRISPTTPMGEYDFDVSPFANKAGAPAAILLDRLVNDLRRAIGEIPGATLSEER